MMVMMITMMMVMALFCHGVNPPVASTDHLRSDEKR